MSRWKFLRLDKAERSGVHDLKAMFAAAARQFEYSQTGVNNLEIEVGKAAVTLTKDELKAGVYHRYRDGRPFYRIRVAARNGDKEAEKMIQTMIDWLRRDKAIKVNPLAIEFDARGDLGEIGIEMAATLVRTAPLVKRYASYEAAELVKKQMPPQPPPPQKP